MTKCAPRACAASCIVVLSVAVWGDIRRVAKLILNARAATTPNAEIVARGEAELGIQLISEIVSVQGAELLGPLPAELQAMTVILS